MEESNLFFDGTRKVDKRGVESFDASSGKVFEKAAEGYEMIGLSESGEVFVADVVGVTVKFQTIFSEEFGVDF